MPSERRPVIVCNGRAEAWSTDDLCADEIEWEKLPGCPFEIMERMPCDPLYRLVSMEEDEDGVVTMVLERVGEDDA